MKVVKLEDIKGTDRAVDGGNWISYRLLLKDDNMGYSVNETIIRAGTETHIHYKNHLEAVYCIEGHAEVETVKDGKVHTIKANTLYSLDEHDEHLLRGIEDARMICVFNPPLSGREIHDENGVYPVDED